MNELRITTCGVGGTTLNVKSGPTEISIDKSTFSKNYAVLNFFFAFIYYFGFNSVTLFDAAAAADDKVHVPQFGTKTNSANNNDIQKQVM